MYIYIWLSLQYNILINGNDFCNDNSIQYSNGDKNWARSSGVIWIPNWIVSISHQQLDTVNNNTSKALVLI